MNARKRVELLAPAGNKEGFYGAIHAGADAVYLGGRRFGARAYADNFTTEDLTACIRYAHIWGRRVYLTVNTLVKENELKELYEYLAPFYEAGLDAVIVQDMGALHYIKNHFPGLALHASTQMTITGVHGAGLLKEMGAVRIVPARELKLSEIVEIKRRTDMELECFIHGAMCYSYSGQCLFSSILGGRSGNRGRCAQPCRLPYTVKGTDGRTRECYPLSLKDLCTLEHLPELIEAGIDSFKIEGRMKKPEYAAGVTAIYRKYIDRYYAADTFSVENKDMQALSSLYIRSEIQDGYYHKHSGRDMITLTSPAYSGSDEKLLSEIREKYLNKASVIPVALEARFVCGQPAQLTISLTKAAAGSRTVTGAMVEAAQNRPVTRETIEKQLCKLGGSCFSLERLEVLADENIFLPLKALNELRRAAVAALEEMLIETWKAEGKISAGGNADRNMASDINMDAEANPLEVISAASSAEYVHPQGMTENGMILSLQTFEQLKGLYSWIKEAAFKGVGKIYINGDILTGNSNISQQALDICRLLSERCETVIALPYILRMSDTAYLERLYVLAENHFSVFSGFLVRSMEGLGFLTGKRYRGKLYADAGFYFWNTEGIACLQPYFAGICLPLELNGREQQALLLSGEPCEKIIYGRIPMMLTANCVAKTTEGCQRGKSKGGDMFQLIDRYKKQFPVYLNCAHCMNIIYNSVPLSLHGQLEKWQGRVAMRLDFTVEDSDEMLHIIQFFWKTGNGKQKTETLKPPYKEYTTGHEKRGVE